MDSEGTAPGARVRRGPLMRERTATIPRGEQQGEGGRTSEESSTSRGKGRNTLRRAFWDERESCGGEFTLTYVCVF